MNARHITYNENQFMLNVILILQKRIIARRI